MFLQAHDCMIYYEVLRYDYTSLSNQFNLLNDEYNILLDDCKQKLVDSHSRLVLAEENLVKEQSRKRTWRSIAITEGVVILGIVGLGFLVF